MMAFQVNDMTCSHCAGTITKALKSADRGANVTIDLARHLVMVEPTEADEQELQDAIAGAGYAPVGADAPGAEASPGVGRSGRGACG